MEKKSSSAFANFSNNALPVVAIVGVAAMSRLLPHLPNVTPIAAMALFAGAKLNDRRAAILLTLAAMVLSDLVIGFDLTSPFVYLSLGLVALLGSTLRGKGISAQLFGCSLLGSALFFVITNFGVWLMQAMYPKSLDGLLLCYTAAIPFFRSSVVGDLCFTAALFGVYSFLSITQRRAVPHSA